MGDWCPRSGHPASNGESPRGGTGVCSKCGKALTLRVAGPAYRPILIPRHKEAAAGELVPVASEIIGRSAELPAGAVVSSPAGAGTFEPEELPAAAEQELLPVMPRAGRPESDSLDAALLGVWWPRRAGRRR